MRNDRSGRNVLTAAVILTNPEVRKALRALQRHANGMYGALKVLHPHRKDVAVLFPSSVDLSALLDQLFALGAGPPRKQKRGRKTIHTRAALAALLRDVETVKALNGWRGHGSDRAAIEGLILEEWRKTGAERLRTPEDLVREYQHRRALLAKARRICGEIRAKKGG